MPDRQLRVMSYNIRNNASDGPNHWVHRKEFWASTVATFDPDLLGLQEVGETQYEQVVGFFPGYEPIGAAKDGPGRGEWALILFRRDRFDRLDAGDFWLSQTPEISSQSWDSTYVRICTWVKVRDRISGRVIVHANTHFDHAGPIARAESAKLVRSRLSRLSEKSSIILTGDFNCTEFDEPYRLLTTSEEGMSLRDSYRAIRPQVSDDEATYHAFNGSTAGHRLDWILHSPDLVPKSAEIVRTKGPDGRWPSDHFAVTAVFE